MDRPSALGQHHTAAETRAAGGAARLAQHDAEIRTAAAALSRGHGGVVWTGDPGSGRSTLLDVVADALVNAATSEGMRLRRIVVPRTLTEIDERALAPADGVRLLLLADDLDHLAPAVQTRLLDAATRPGSPWVLLATRTSGPVADASPLPHPLVERRVSPLTAPDALLVLAEHDIVAAPHVVASLVRASSGNPAALLQTVPWLTNEQLDGTSLLPDPMAVPAATERLVGTRLVDLSLAEHRFLLIAAITVVDRTDVLVRAAGTDAATIATWPAAALLNLAGGRCRILEPGVRALVHARATLAERTDAHLALASALAASDMLAAEWHRSLGTLAGDGAHAAGLLAIAEQLLARGDCIHAVRVAREALSHGADEAEPGAHAIAGAAALGAGLVHDAVHHLRRASHPTIDVETLAQHALQLTTQRPEPQTDWGLAPLAATHLSPADDDALRATDEALRTALAGSADDARRTLGMYATTMLEPIQDHTWRTDPLPRPSALAQSHVRVTQALLDMLDARFDLAADLLDEHARALPVPLVLGSLATALAGRLVALGAAGPRGIVGAVARHPAPSSFLLRIASLENRALVAFAEGSAAEAAALLELATEQRRRAPGPAHDLTLPCLTPAEAWAETGRADQHLPTTVTDDSAPATRVLRERSRVALTGLTMVGPDGRTGVSDVDGATDWDAAMVELSVGRAFLRAGEPHRAHTHVLAAAELLDLTGARTIAAAARQRLATLTTAILAPPPGPAPSVASAPTSASGAPRGIARWRSFLTERELEVAELVAQGASNREIAETLYLSVRTVEVYLGRAFRKLGVTTRVELAVRAHED
ncbi:LuxR C-terminal-related transcriptional regulator [Sanguibacter sp. A247]|uniref:LuxR C-terminal-related transcriptional regulator n=1 Tax=unclassified Sanguibacter TaxID=2645534 RepID=UPI003FD8BB81